MTMPRFTKDTEDAATRTLYGGCLRTRGARWESRKCVIGGRTTNGENKMPVRIEVDDTYIVAFPATRRDVVTQTFSEGGKKVRFDVDEKLSEHLSEESVLRFIKSKPGEFVVDFDAGFQRGRKTIDRSELCRRAYWPNDAPGYVKWVGLRCKDPVIAAWLRV